MESKTLRRTPALVALIGLVAVILSGCGLKPASVTTFDENFKGERVITVTIAQKEVTEHATGGAEAADAAINKHLPEGITYSGSSVSGENLVGTFTITFDNLDDYKAKIKSLLVASGKGEPVIEIRHAKEGLVTGFSAEENFTDTDLLSWAKDALIAEGVVKDSGVNVFDAPEKPVVKFADKSYTSEWTSVKINDVIDNGVKLVAMVISLLPGDDFATTIYLDNREAMTSVQREKIKEFLNGHLPEGATVSDDKPQDDAVSVTAPVTVKFTAASLQDAISKLQTVLGQTNTKVELGEASSAPGSLVVERTIGGEVDCGVLCSTSSSNTALYFKVPASWTLSDPKGLAAKYGDSDQTYSYLYAVAPVFDAKVKVTLPVERVTTDFAVGLSGSLTYTMDVMVDANADPSLKESYDAALAVDKSVGKLTTSDEDGTWTYTVKVEGKDATEFSSKLAKLIPDSELVTADLSKEGRKGTRYELNVPFRAFFGDAVTNPIEQKVSLPFMHSLVDPQRYVGMFKDVNGRTLTVNEEAASEYLVFEESGPSLTTFIVWGVLLSLLLIAGIVAWFLREKIKVKLSQYRQARAVAAQQRAQEQAHYQAQAPQQPQAPYQASQQYAPTPPPPPTAPSAPATDTAAMPPEAATPPTVYPGNVPPPAMPGGVQPEDDDFELQ